MKTNFTFWSAVICTASVFIAGCDKDQKTLNKLDGTWQLEQVTHLTQDTTKLPTSGTISFTSCDLDDAAKSCPGTYTFNAQASSALTFNVFEGGKELGMFHTGNYNTYNYSDKYKIVQRSDNRLELEGNLIVVRKPAGANPVTKQVRVGIVLER
ncbi:hypothetical protein [Pontibacter rugosus]|uniref:Lipocalin-like domain-containing protein n=1 Tax=Pontibacter rugosus TaxID=1745966 RepID=A0ABW3SSK2_9BACT